MNEIENLRLERMERMLEKIQSRTGWILAIIIMSFVANVFGLAWYPEVFLE